MGKETRFQTLTIIAFSVISIWVVPSSARGEEPFLWLPFPTNTRTPGDCRGDCLATGVCIYCTWSSCVDGAAYNHLATDYGCTGTNTEVRAAADGEVIFVDDGMPESAHPRGRPYGNRVEIRHANRYVTVYAHLLPGLRVAEGDRITAGQLLGLSDNTGRSSGPHLHFEVRDAQGRRVNPYGDPPDYTGGCGTNALWVTCPPTPAPPSDADGDGFTAAAGDCDDTNRDVHPGAAESCNNRDDDCNGTPDDPWRIGLAQDIGNQCRVGTGACVNAGTWACTPDGRATACNVDPLPPQPEACNGFDDDCDGEIDEDWRTGLAQDIGNPCTISWDACRGSTAGEWVCTPDGLAVVCNAPTPGGTPALPESCNGTDDDCDGTTDNVPDRTIYEIPDFGPNLWNPMLAWDGAREQLLMSWIETHSIPPGFDSEHALYSLLLERTGDPIGPVRSLSGAYRSAFGRAVAWNGEEYGVVWRVSTGSWASDRELQLIRLDPDGVPIAEPVVVGDPLLIVGVPVPGIGNEVRIVPTRDGWLAAEGGPLSRQDANNNLYGNIRLSRFSREGTAISTPVFVNDDRRRQVDPATFGLVSVGGREILAWAIFHYGGPGAGTVFGEAWEGSSRIQQVTLGTPERGRSISRPTIACTAEASCWIAWHVGGYGDALSLGTLDVDALTVTPVTSVPLSRTSGDYEFACTETGCTLVTQAMRIDGSGYELSVVLVSSDGTAAETVRTITPAQSPTVQRMNDRSVVVWNRANRHVRTVVCH